MGNQPCFCARLHRAFLCLAFKGIFNSKEFCFHYFKALLLIPNQPSIHPPTQTHVDMHAYTSVYMWRERLNEYSWGGQTLFDRMHGSTLHPFSFQEAVKSR